MYNALHYVHVLSAIVWIGGGYVAWMGTRQTLAVDGQSAAVRETAVSREWMGKYVFGPAPVLVLLTGVIMILTEAAWKFSQAWVYLALVLFVVVGVMGGGIGGRLEKAITASHEDGTADSSEAGDLIGRYLRLGGIELVVLAVLVALMVFKPGI